MAFMSFPHLAILYMVSNGKIFVVSHDAHVYAFGFR
jgi:hypothetical protein